MAGSAAQGSQCLHHSNHDFYKTQKASSLECTNDKKKKKNFQFSEAESNKKPSKIDDEKSV